MLPLVILTTFFSNYNHCCNRFPKIDLSFLFVFGTYRLK